MTEIEAIGVALGAVGGGEEGHVLVRRKGRAFMALPVDRVAAGHALNLYQPQRPKAVMAVLMVRLLALWGLHRYVLPSLRHREGEAALDPLLTACVPGTAGVMLGSPEHKVRRAIVSFCSDRGWDVAKLAFGEAGREVIANEAVTLAAMPSSAPGIPQVLGVHHGPHVSLLRLPNFHAHPLQPGENLRGLDLLEAWLLDLPARPIADFPEWSAIHAALSVSEAGRQACERLSRRLLRPAIRHGDFARWNLLQGKDGLLVAIDWEWGQAEGMPGVDLVHLFAQDARLVYHLPPAKVAAAVEQQLANPRCRQYLESCGWGGDVRAVFLAALALTVGTKQQENEEVMDVVARSLEG